MCQRQQIWLDNGLRVELIEDPQASRASALLQVAAGSHHEPDAWPGLAHLLEHLLFADSATFQGDQRLMPWIQAQGGRLNATTQGASTAFFFECAAPQLAEGLARMTDMLTAPLLTEAPIRQEVAIIDAECRLLADHQDMRCAAALSTAFCGPHPWQRFYVGDRAHFGADCAALRTALQQFHQSYYHAGNSTLWLQGPQPLIVLRQLAALHAACFTRSGNTLPQLPALQLRSERELSLQLPGATRLRVSFLLAADLKAELILLRQLLLDEAEGSLMANLRARRLCDEARLLLPYCSTTQTVVSIEFSVCIGQSSQRVAALLHQGLQQLAQLNAEQLHHYAKLAKRQFYRLTPMDQLRERAFGFAPADHSPARWRQLCQQLQPARRTRLWIDAQPPLALREEWIQGLRLTLGKPPMTEDSSSDSVEPALNFFPRDRSHAMPQLPMQRAILAHHPWQQHDAVLLLSPAVCLPDPWGQILQADLRALAGNCAHHGGELRISCQQGLWLIQIHGSAALMLSTLAAVIDQLRALPGSMIMQGADEYHRQQEKQRQDIAVRALLIELGKLLQMTEYSPAGAALPDLPWQACLYGGDKQLHQQLSRLLTRFPGRIIPSCWSPPAALPLPVVHPVVGDSEEAAVLLFCPLVENSAQCLAAWQLLAALYQPHFFQRLRVEQNTGYVVSSRFYQVSGHSGILFILQSADLTVDQLFQHIDRFLADIAEVIAGVSPEWLQEHSERLLATLHESHPEAMERSQAQWLQQRYQMNVLTPQLFNQLKQTPLLYWHQQLCASQNMWWRVCHYPQRVLPAREDNLPG